MAERIEQTNTQKLRIFGATKSKEESDFVGIEKEAKQILDKFAKALEKVEKEYELNFFVEREEFERIERVASSESLDSENSTFAENSKFAENSTFAENSEFKQRILENAPEKDDEFIIAEKGSWKT